MNIYLLLLNILALILSISLTFFTKNIYEKILLLFSSFFQFLVVIFILINKENKIKFIGRIFVFCIIVGIFIIKNFYINMFIIFLLLITLITRYYFKRCLFYLYDEKYEKKILSDIAYFIFLIIYLLKAINIIKFY